VPGHSSYFPFHFATPDEFTHLATKQHFKCRREGIQRRPNADEDKDDGKDLAACIQRVRGVEANVVTVMTVW